MKERWGIKSSSEERLDEAARTIRLLSHVLLAHSVDGPGNGAIDEDDIFTCHILLDDLADEVKQVADSLRRKAMLTITDKTPAAAAR